VKTLPSASRVVACGQTDRRTGRRKDGETNKEIWRS